MGKVLIEEISELFDKQVNAQKESLKKYFWIHAGSCKPTKKVCNENERNKKKQRMHKINVVDDRKLLYKPHTKN